MPHTAPTCSHVPGPATLGDFVASCGAGTASSLEWSATLPDFTRVVVSDVRGAPSAVGLERTVSIVQSRTYLEHRARQLLTPFTKEVGTWQLATLDFGSEARRHRCQFLMCFAFRPAQGVLSITSPSVDIGFALPPPATGEPVFILSAVAAVNFSMQGPHRFSFYVCRSLAAGHHEALRRFEANECASWRMLAGASSCRERRVVQWADWTAPLLRQYCQRIGCHYRRSARLAQLRPAGIALNIG
ncbi:MAG: hypothetical protein ABI633_11215 [Burkholderiales bacterium]